MAAVRCDNIRDCPDNEDELNCGTDNYEPDLICSEEEFKCDNRCLNLNYHCDGHIDCEDQTDEAGCPTKEEQAPQPNPEQPEENWVDNVCQPNEFRCHNGECISSDKHCDNVSDCSEGEDENEDCDIDEPNTDTFDKDEIIRNYADHNKHLYENRGHYGDRPRLDGDDAKEYEVYTPNGYEAYPPKNVYVKVNSDSVCSSNQFKCTSANICIPLHMRCDGYYHCNDMSDERDCENYVVPKTTRRPPISRPSTTTRITTTRTTSAPERPSWPAWTARPRPPASLEIGPTSSPRASETVATRTNPFLITSTTTTPLPTAITSCAAGQFRCRDGHCISQEAVCDNYPQCPDGSDEADCHTGECLSNQFRCRNGQCVSAAARCNRQTDCLDGSDEQSCANEPANTPRNQLLLKTYPDSQSIKERYIREGREVVFRCRDEGPARAKVRWSRPGGRPLPVGFTDKNGRLEIPNIRVSIMDYEFTP
ncbi:uncharacterized protein Dwil_GK27490 [Drosophila willistoni]|uniref:Ig-like domain-containing protein n=1 Tax=Drosophila willistoni TaxID=7260 RepID=A0A0Q9X645_DROWI|nr:uncharacterized protein Dwil_GK27490 [Drosophila willistoni]